MQARRRRAPRRPAVVLALLALCVLLAACTVGPSRRPPLATRGAQAPTTSTTTSTSMPTGPGGPGREADPIQWLTCPPSVRDTAADGTRFRVQCAGVAVPVSYSDPSQGSFAIRVARALAKGTPQDAPPLLVLRGGPGQNGRAAVASVAATLPTEIQRHYSVITVDLRGTGRSSGIDCISDSTERAIVGLAADPTTSKGAAQLRSISRQLTFDCGDLVGPSLTQFNSTNAADDLDTLRAALGVRTIAVLGRGYGATIAAVYAHRYPGRVAAMVLDSPTDTLSSPDRQAEWSATAAHGLLADFAAACPGFDGGCPLGDDPVDAVTDLVHRLATSGDAAGQWVITGGSVLLALLELLPDRQTWPDLARALEQLDRGQARPLADMLTGSLGGQRLPEMLAGRLVYRCNDTTERMTAQQIASAVKRASEHAPLFGPFTVALAGLCSDWPAPDDALGRLTATGAVPIVVIGSVNNPLHPYRGVQAMATQLVSGVLISWQSGANSAYPASACVTKAVDAYLLHGTKPPIGMLCPP